MFANCATSGDVTNDMEELRSALRDDFADIVHNECTELRKVIKQEMLDLTRKFETCCMNGSPLEVKANSTKDIFFAPVVLDAAPDEGQNTATATRKGHFSGSSTKSYTDVVKTTQPVSSTCALRESADAKSPVWDSQRQLPPSSQTKSPPTSHSKPSLDSTRRSGIVSWMTQSFEGLPRPGDFCTQLLNILQDERNHVPKNVVATLLPKILFLLELREPVRHGRLVRIIHSSQFQALMMLVIAANVCVVTFDVNARIDHQFNPAVPYDMHAHLRHDLIFLIIYVIDLVLRLMVHRLYFFINHHWKMNLFDFVLALTCSLDLYVQVSINGHLWIFRVARVLRVAKFLQIFRAIRFLHEVRLMLDSIRESLTTLFWCLVVTVLFLFFFAVMLMHGVTLRLEHDKHAVDMVSAKAFFGTVETSLITLFQSGTGGVDWKDVYNFLDSAGGWGGAVFVFYIAFFTIVTMNIITSTFLDKAARLAQPDFDSLLLEKHRRDLADAEQLLDHLRMLNPDTSKVPTLTRAEFVELLSHQNFVDFLDVRGIGIKDAEMFFDMLVSVGTTDSVEVPTLINNCLRLKGTASSIDLQTFNFEMRQLFNQQRVHLRSVLDACNRLEDHVQKKLPIMETDGIAHLV